MEYEDQLTPQAVRYLFEELGQQLVDYQKSHYKLGRLLHRIRGQRLYEKARHRSGRGRGFETWAAFCDEYMARSRSWADGLCSNYEKLSAMELDEQGDTFLRCMALGWNKLNEVLRVAGNEDNLIRWLDHAEDLSTANLRLKINEAKRAAWSQPAPEEAEDAPEVEPQGASGGSAGASRSRSRPAPPPEPEGDPDQPLSPQNPAGYVSHRIRFPDNESQEVYTKALRVIRNRYDSDMGDGTCIGMMAMHYLATVPSEAEGGAPSELEDVIRLMEVTYGVRLQVVDAEVETTTSRVNKRRAAAKKKQAAKKKAKRKKKSTGSR